MAEYATSKPYLTLTLTQSHTPYLGVSLLASSVSFRDKVSATKFRVFFLCNLSLSGTQYVGDFTNGVMEGEGRLTYPPGHMIMYGRPLPSPLLLFDPLLLSSFFRVGMNTDGKNQWSPAVSYTGSFVGGQKHGKGKLEVDKYPDDQWSFLSFSLLLSSRLFSPSSSSFDFLSQVLGRLG